MVRYLVVDPLLNTRTHARTHAKVGHFIEVVKSDKHSHIFIKLRYATTTLPPKATTCAWHVDREAVGVTRAQQFVIYVQRTLINYLSI